MNFDQRTKRRKMIKEIEQLEHKLRTIRFVTGITLFMGGVWVGKILTQTFLIP